MSDVHGAQPLNDDGFSPEERAQFAAMETADGSAPADTGGDAGGAPGGGDGAAAGAAAAGDQGAGKGAGAAAGGDGGDKSGGAVDPAVAARKAAQDALAGDDDDDDDADHGGQQAGQQQNGQQQPKKRVSAKKYNRLQTAFNELQARLNQQDVDRARLDERLAILNEALTPKQKAAQQEEDPEPDPEKDIFAHNAWLKRQQLSLSKKLDDLMSGRQQERQSNDLATAYMQDAQQFSANEPNFVPAYQHLIGSRTVELAMFYFGKDITDGQTQLTPQELQRVKQEIAGEERALVEEAIKNKQSPAQRVFMLAKARGYRPAAATAAGNGAGAAPAGGQGAGAQQNGSGAPAGGQNGAAPGQNGAQQGGNVVDEVERIRAGQEAARSLSNGGGAPPRQLSAETLLKMDDKQFGELLEQMTPEDERRFFGG